LALGFSGDAVDGCVGPETLAAAGEAGAWALIEELSSRQAAYYRSLPEYGIFGQGWIHRTDARRDAALAMLDRSKTQRV
jgi:lysozyme family protein